MTYRLTVYNNGNVLDGRATWWENFTQSLSKRKDYNVSKFWEYRRDVLFEEYGIVLNASSLEFVSEEQAVQFILKWS